MKILSAPPQPDFSLYIVRSDTKFIEREKEDSLEELYAEGYLPYSGSKDLHAIFYSARSARVVLQSFVLTSENRRIAKKFDGQFVKRRIPAKDFTPDEAFYTFVLSYFAQKHGSDVMPRARVEVLFESNIISTIIEYQQDGKIVGYVFEIEDGNMRHFWYSAYDLSLTTQSLGLWMLLDCIRDAKAEGFISYYVGTVYGPKALYKANFEPLEWWNASLWSKDIAALKECARNE